MFLCSRGRSRLPAALSPNTSLTQEIGDCHVEILGAAKRYLSGGRSGTIHCGGEIGSGEEVRADRNL